VVVGALLATAVVAALVALGIGSFRVSVPDVVRALLGQGPEQLQTLVGDWRLPRVAMALMFGAALGASGAIFQSLTRNPLGSPDVIGFDAGAYTGVLLTIIVSGGTNQAVLPGAIVGGVVTALAVYLLAYKRGVQGFRLIVVGIAVTAVLGSLNGYLLLKTELWQAMMAAVWAAGSLNGLDWSDARTAAVWLALLVPPLLVFVPRMRMIEMGDDAARALGVRVERDRVALVVLGVALSSTVTALTGPIAFVALAAPQIARRMTRAPGVQVVPAAATGATLLLVCDVVAANAFAPVILPAGLVTVVLGGCYLVWLLARQVERGRT
jgi:iron complex transport system permease protein